MMKRMFWLYTLLCLVGCTEVAIEDNIPTTSEEYYATIEDGNSRTYVDGQIRMRWTAEDKITVFTKNTYNRTFMFTGKTGDNAGGFRQTSVDDPYWFGYDVANSYAVYPHSTDNKLDETDLYLTLNMPSEQTYAENSFGLEANTMVAISDNNQLIFKNVCSYLRVRLYGNNTSVSSITLTNKGNEAIAGEAKVTPAMNGEPTCAMTGSGKSIRLTCPTPVSISSDAKAPTDFWMVVPPVTLASGFTVTVENSVGQTQTYNVNKSFTFERNKYNNMVRELEIEDILTIHVAQAGTLSSLIDENEKYTISELKITGDLNGTDVKFIREMLGVGNVVNNTLQLTEGKLSNLDISKANIVDGGDSYFTINNEYNNYTTDNTIGSHFFAYTRVLKTIKLPSSITNIDAYSFANSSLINIEIPKSVNNIGEEAFRDCSELTKINFPNTNMTIGREAFKNCNNLTSIYITDLETWCKNEFKSDNSNPLYYAKKLYVNNEIVNVLTIPNSITSINNHAFIGCTSLTQITIPNSVKNIGYMAFGDCNNLANVTMGNSVETIGGYAFYGCSNLISINIPNSTTDIGYGTFSGCTNLSSITLGESIEKIGGYTFQNCSKLNNITIPNSVDEIQTSAFKGCSNLTSIVIPNSIKSIGTHAFENCTNLVSATLGNSLISIGEEAFKSCSSLTNIIIPNSVISLGTGAFWGCSMANKVIVGNSVEKIGVAVFWSCGNLTDITIGSSVKEIHNGTFSNSNKMVSFTSLAQTPPTFYTSLNQGSFPICDAVLYVPKGCKSAYASTTGWNSYFKEIKEFD